VNYQSRVYGKLASIKEQHENEGTERLMIGNVPELQEAARREVVVGEVGTAAPEFVTPTFYKNKIFVQIGMHIKMHIKL
jgi:hypothetical protein